MKKIVFMIVFVLMSVFGLVEAWAKKAIVSPTPIFANCNFPVDDSGYGAHDAIADAASVYQNFDDAILRNIAVQYFSGPWRGSFISGYGIYAMARAAMRHRSQLSGSTRFYIGCVFRDIRLSDPDDSLSITCGGLGNSCAEEYMGRALAFAAHDGWYRNYSQYENMANNVDHFVNEDNAFNMIPDTNSPGQYSFMWHWYGVGESRARLFNHQTESPVYGMLTVGHLNHIRRIYQEAELIPPDFSPLRSKVEEIMDWIRTKINDVPPFLFMDAACGHVSDPWGDICNCADRPETGPGGVSCNPGGIERHPHHYPMLNILNHLGIPAFLQWPWNDPDFDLQACSPNQGYHNWVFNCLFS